MASPQMKSIDLSWNHDPNFECFISLNSFINIGKKDPFYLQSRSIHSQDLTHKDIKIS